MENLTQKTKTERINITEAYDLAIAYVQRRTKTAPSFEIWASDAKMVRELFDKKYADHSQVRHYSNLLEIKTMNEMLSWTISSGESIQGELIEIAV